MNTQTRCGAPAAPYNRLPACAGIGLKPAHFAQIVESWPAVGFFEIHAENYFVAGGPFHHFLGLIREKYPLSIHGVGLSVGGVDALNTGHLEKLSELLERYEPAAFSEHLAWSGHGGTFLNDLLPLPYTAESLQRVCEHIDQVQSALKRSLLIENPATYIEFERSSYVEADFISEIVRRTGCGLLLDVSNVFVSCTNHGWDIEGYLSALPLNAAGEIHLAGFTREEDSNRDPLLIDSHSGPVDERVWSCYESVLAHCGPKPTLIEWDSNVPSLSRWMEEAQRADTYMLSRTSR
jgi:uncharacterized protein (UPF0276 family)